MISLLWSIQNKSKDNRKEISSCLGLGEGNGSPLQCSCLENPRDGKPGWLPSMGSHRVGHDWSDLAAAAVAKSQLTGKDPDAEKEWRQEEKGTLEDEMVGWHHWLNGHESEQAWGVGDGQGSLACYSTWGHKQSNTTEQLNNKKAYT